MSKFNYKIIIDQLPQRGVGNGFMKPDVVVVHHSAVELNGDYDMMKVLGNYAQNHMSRIGNPGLSYHFYIPRLENDPNIYVTRYLNQIQWHCSNGGFNARSVGVLVDGNFETQQPLDIQLRKLRQLLDDLQNNTVFPGNADIANLKPKDNQTIRTERGTTLKGGLAFHNEVAERGYGTSCCGKNFSQYIVDYRNKAGNVSWGINPSPNPTPTPPPTNVDLSKYVLITECDSRVNFVAGNLRSRIEQLELEKNALLTARTRLEEQIRDSGVTINRLTEERNRLQVELNECRANGSGGSSETIRQLQDEIARQTSLLQQYQNQILILRRELDALRGGATASLTGASANDVLLDSDNPTLSKPSAQLSWKTKFIAKWNKLPTFVRYLVPNLISFVIPAIILYIENFDMTVVETLGVLGLSQQSIKSLIIGYLRSLDKKLKGDNDE